MSRSRQLPGPGRQRRLSVMLAFIGWPPPGELMATLWRCPRVVSDRSAAKAPLST